ncbi:hypothetical protein ABH935_007362 [Catenulispora sp. GAS73]|uniref:hypothetical protein n=1 Tax=Catenulispora sp. GAS73 TaxID=3156269 RepID=UPI00351682FA
MVMRAGGRDAVYGLFSTKRQLRQRGISVLCGKQPAVRLRQVRVQHRKVLPALISELPAAAWSRREDAGGPVGVAR